MEIHKKGFTLAEVLVTLGIVSIVAALTIPQIAGNTEKRKNAAMFGKIYQTIEAKAKQYLFRCSADGVLYSNIADTDANWQERLLSLNTGLGMTLIPGANDSYTMDKMTGEFQLSFPNIAIANIHHARTRIMNITIDTNGFNRRPNQNGIDRFELFMTNDGKLHTDDNATRTVINNEFKIE